MAEAAAIGHDRGEHVATEAESRASARRQPLSLGAFPALAVVSSVGLVAIALGNNAAREGGAAAVPLFWAGLALIYAPIAFRLLSISASRAERICLVVWMGVALFMVKVLYSPLSYPPFDELATWRQVHELLETGRPFSDNPVAAGFPGFPGLETTSAALVRLADLSIFHAGVIVIGVARGVLMLALFLFFERVSGSARAAGVAVAVYACNPSFLYFDSQFGHESLALALGACLLLAVVDWSRPRRLDTRVALGFVGAIVVLSCSLTITHHMTSYGLTAFLVLWALLAARASRRSALNNMVETIQPVAAGVDRSQPLGPLSRSPIFPAILLFTTTALWFVFVGGSDTIAELGSVFSGAVDSISRLVFGGSGPKTLFQGSGQSNSTLARILAFASVIPVLALIPFGIMKVWRKPDSLWHALAIAALMYPVTLGLRLTLSGTETSQRASEFVFVGLAFLAAILLLSYPWPTRPVRRLAATAGLTLVGTIVFCGAFIVAELPATRQPGPFLVGADARSVSPQGLAAARFAAEYLPHSSRIVADRPNGTLLGSYGGLDPVLGQIHGIPVARVLFSQRFDELDQKAIRNDEIDYVVVDQRLHRELPSLGFYVEPDEPGAFTRTEPISRTALDKFELATGLNRIYTNGPVAIYATSRLRSRRHALVARP